METKKKGYLKEVAGIFSCVVFCVYSWLLLIFFWDLPAFLFYLGVGDIIGYLAYQFTFALGESILVTLFVAGLLYLIPSKRIRSNIAIAGSLMVFSFAVSAIIFKGLGDIAAWLANTFSMNRFNAVQISVNIWVFSMIALPILSIGLANKSKVARFIRNFIDNLYVLVALYTTLSVLSMAIVIYRNIP